MRGEIWRIVSLLFAPLVVKANFVINTWSGVFEQATLKAFQTLNDGKSALDAVEQGCKVCEHEQCDTSVGYGNHPDSSGHTSLDAMIMDGNTFDVGSVAYIRKYRDAISIARAVMTYTTHSMLVGDGAEEFAQMMGFTSQSASTSESVNIHKDWVTNNNCQPNFYDNIEEAKTQCGPYKPSFNNTNNLNNSQRFTTTGTTTATTAAETSIEVDVKVQQPPPPAVSSDAPDVMKSGVNIIVPTRKVTTTTKLRNWVNPSANHDTIGMVTIDHSGTMACGTSTNGANHKIAGRVGDSPIPGAGCYVDSTVGGCAATGDGDVMLRFLPTFYAVMLMKQGHTPEYACRASLLRIVDKTSSTGRASKTTVAAKNRDTNTYSNISSSGAGGGDSFVVENSENYSTFSGGIVCVNKEGVHGGWAHNMSFSYSYMRDGDAAVQVVKVT